jgi:hypothetical protein
LRATLRGVLVALAAVAVGDWIALRSGALQHPSQILAAIVGTLLLLLAIETVLTLVELRSAERRLGILLDIVSRLLVLSGLALLLGGGFLNWGRRIQGFVILHEGESVALRGGAQLQEFDSGPLTRVDDLDVALSLVKVELKAEGPEHFYPESRLVVIRRGIHDSRILAPRRPAEVGDLRLYQGAFGFAPRIVVVHDRDTLFDRTVPFLTEKKGAGGVSFAGEFSIEKEKLRIRGNVDLAGLDESMAGHAVLHLAVSKDGKAIGEGTLMPGHFASISEGYRVGFAGLKKWSEIDVSRKNYPVPMFTGAGIMIAGLLLWPVGLLLRRRS